MSCTPSESRAVIRTPHPGGLRGDVGPDSMYLCIHLHAPFLCTLVYTHIYILQVHNITYIYIDIYTILVNKKVFVLVIRGVVSMVLLCLTVDWSYVSWWES